MAEHRPRCLRAGMDLDDGNDDGGNLVQAKAQDPPPEAESPVADYFRGRKGVTLGRHARRPAHAQRWDLEPHSWGSICDLEPKVDLLAEAAGVDLAERSRSLMRCG